MAWKEEIARLEFLLKEAKGELSNANAIITKQEIEMGTLFSEKDMKDFLNWSKDAVYNNADELLACWKERKHKMEFGEDLDD